jgi:hypothetical protein
LQALKEQLARKPPAPKPEPAARTATIYRGNRERQIVYLNRASVTELAPEESLGNPETTAIRMQRGFRTGSLGSPDDETAP